MKKLLIFIFALLFSAGACAAPVEPGQPLPKLSLQDQRDQPWRVEDNTRLVLFSSGRKASNLVQDVLASQPKDFLATRQAAYLADMSRMPSFITRNIALPTLRDKPFSVGVVLDEKLLADWPRQTDAVTLISLQDGKVTAVAYATTEAQVRAALGLGQ